MYSNWIGDSKTAKHNLIPKLTTATMQNSLKHQKYVEKKEARSNGFYYQLIRSYK